MTKIRITEQTLGKLLPVQAKELPLGMKLAFERGTVFEVEDLSLGPANHYKCSFYFYKDHVEPMDAPGLPTKAIFSLKAKSSSRLLYGILNLFDKHGRIVATFNATSGQAGYQSASHCRTRGKGMCPPYQGLKILTNGYHLSNPGIAGLFYPIVPSPVPGWGRSELGLHRDANKIYAPGSAGCIVLPDFYAWEEEFVPLMKRCHAEGIAELDLEVQY